LKTAEEINVLARGRWGDILPEVCNLPRELFDGKSHPCPLCGKGDDRFTFTDKNGEGSVHCRHCIDKVGDGIGAVIELLRIPFIEALPLLQKHLGIHGNQRNGLTLKVKGNHFPLFSLWCSKHRQGISPDTLVRNGAELQDTTEHGKSRKVIAVPITGIDENSGWIHLPLDGQPLHDKRGRDLKVKIRQGGRPGWVGKWGVEQIKAGKAEWVFKCEGVSDMLTLSTLLGSSEKYVAITNHAGAGSILSREFLEQLRGLNIVIVCDNDGPGIRGGLKYAESLYGIGSTVRLLIMKKEGEDLSDWERGLSVEPDKKLKMFMGLVKECELYTPERETTKEELDITHPTDLDTLDPLQLAEDFLKRDNEVIVWKGVDWVRRPDGTWEVYDGKVQFPALVGRFLHKRTDEIFIDKREATNKNEDPIRTKCSRILRAEVITAVRDLRAADNTIDINSMVTIPSFGESGLVNSEIGRQDWIAMGNQIFMIDAFLRHEDAILQPRNPNWFSPIRLPFEYNPIAGDKDRRWFLNFLEEQVQDKASIEMIQEFAGLILTADNSMQRFLFLQGKAGSGKSTLLAVMRALVGGEAGASSVTLNEFSSDKYALYHTLGKLLNIAAETGTNLDKLCEAILTAFTSGDPMMFQKKFADPFGAIPTARLIVSSNPIASFKDRTEGIWRRMLYARMDNVIVDEEQDKGLDKTKFWLQSGEMPGIFNWALGGLRRLRERGRFDEPSLSKELKLEAKMESHPERQFFDEVLESCPQDDFQIEGNEIYRLYRVWQERNGSRMLSQNFVLGQLSKSFETRKIRQRHSDGTRPYYYTGIKKLSDV